MKDNKQRGKMRLVINSLCLLVFAAFITVRNAEANSAESRLELIRVPDVGERVLFVAFHNKDGVCRWSMVEKTLQDSNAKTKSKW